jgi:hypothetical protein
VISGEYKAVELACEKMKEAGAKRALILPVGGAFHSDEEPARERNLLQQLKPQLFNPMSGVPKCN